MQSRIFYISKGNKLENFDLIIIIWICKETAPR